MKKFNGQNYINVDKGIFASPIDSHIQNWEIVATEKRDSVQTFRLKYKKSHARGHICFTYIPESLLQKNLHAFIGKNYAEAYKLLSEE